MLNFYTNICNYIGTRYESGTNYEQRASLFARKYLLPYIYIYIPLVLFLISTRFLISSWWYHHRQEGKVFPCNSKNRLLDTNDHPGDSFRGCCTAGRARVPRILKSQSAFWRKSCLFLCSPLITGEGGGRTKLARNKGTREIVSLSSLVVLVLSRKVNAILSNIYLRNSTKEIYVF